LVKEAVSLASVGFANDQLNTVSIDHFCLMKKSNSDAPFVLQNRFKNGVFKTINSDTIVGIVFTMFRFLIKGFNITTNLFGSINGSWNVRFINTWFGTVACGMIGQNRERFRAVPIPPLAIPSLLPQMRPGISITSG
jgi:hypothetical protein